MYFVYFTAQRQPKRCLFLQSQTIEKLNDCLGPHRMIKLNEEGEPQEEIIEIHHNLILVIGHFT